MANEPFDEAIKSFKKACETEAGRKEFYRDGGSQRAQALIAELDALRTRAQEFVRA